MARQPDTVTTEYIEAYRLGVLIRTPIENVAFFRAEDKAVVAFTKAGGQFTLDVPLCRITSTLEGQFLLVERSHLVQIALLPGLKHFRQGSHWVFEIITYERIGTRMGLLPTIIPVSRRLTQKVKACLAAI